jgi:serine/threonine protein kinase
MVTNAGRVKVLGFGIARHTPLPTDATRVPTLAGTLGPTGQAIGTPGYMAPEQVAGQARGPGVRRLRARCGAALHAHGYVRVRRRLRLGNHGRDDARRAAGADLIGPTNSPVGAYDVRRRQSSTCPS